MAKEAKRREDASLAPPRVLKDYVDVQAEATQLENALCALQRWIDDGGPNDRMRYATMAATLITSELQSRLVKLMITLAGEE